MPAAALYAWNDTAQDYIMVQVDANGYILVATS